MAKLRKMLGDIRSAECIDLMRLIETQSKATLGAWAVANYLPLCASQRAEECLAACERYIAGEATLKEVKPVLREMTQLARDAQQPAQQAALRAVSVGCAALQTPTNALGFLFYGAAAKAYAGMGLERSAQEYDAAAACELRHALELLKAAAVEGEKNPARIDWNC